MILESFANYLHKADPATPAASILARWLWERLSNSPRDNVDRVIHAEVAMRRLEPPPGQPKGKKPGKEELPQYSFAGTSASGRRLLKSLYEYAASYEQQKWSRWVHCVKASDFTRTKESGK